MVGRDGRRRQFLWALRSDRTKKTPPSPQYLPTPRIRIIFPGQGPLTSISVMSGSSGAQGGVGEAGGPGSASGPLSSVVESVPEESVGSMAARLSRDTLVQAEDRLRFRHQCIGSWDMRGSTLGRRAGQEGQDVASVGSDPPASAPDLSLTPTSPLSSSLWCPPPGFTFLPLYPLSPSSLPPTLFIPPSPGPLASSSSSSPPLPLPPAPTVGLARCRTQGWALGPSPTGCDKPTRGTTQPSFSSQCPSLGWSPPQEPRGPAGSGSQPPQGGPQPHESLWTARLSSPPHSPWRVGALLPGAPSSETTLTTDPQSLCPYKPAS